MIRIRTATEADNLPLLALTRATPMEGLISLRIDRNPDFFSLLRLRGEGATFLAEESDAVIGSVSVSYRLAFVNGMPQRVGYVGDLKVVPSRRGSRAAYLLLRTLVEYASEQETDLYLCFVAAGNKEGMATLNGVATIPKWESIGRFFVCGILPSRRRRLPAHYTITELEHSDLDQITDLANGFYRKYQFGPVVTSAEITPPNGLNGTKPLPPVVARSGGVSVAVVCPFDSASHKSNVVIGMPPALRTAVICWQALGKMISVPEPPRIGRPLRVLYARHLACSEHHRAALPLLVQELRRKAREGRYSLVVVGFHERDPLRNTLSGMPRFTFVSHGFVLSLHGRNQPLSRLRDLPPIEDFALV